MKTNRDANANATANRRRRVPTEFALETRFEIPAQRGPLARARLSARLEALKDRLLQVHLAASEDLTEVPGLRRAASEAAALAWATPYPLLLLPGLLEEKAIEARRQTAVQERIRSRSRLLLEEAA